MSYAEHGPRIFLAGRPSSGVPLTYGDYVLPKKRSEGRLKLYNSCTDIRAWSPNILESTRYFRELNEHDPAVCFLITNVLTLSEYTSRTDYLLKINIYILCNIRTQHIHTHIA